MITEWYIYSKKAGLNLSLDALEVHFVSNGNLQNVVLGAIYAKDACVDLSIDTIKVLDLEKKDINEAIFRKTGRIAFLGHGDPVKFRNIRIRVLKDSAEK